jgi:type II secretory pathway component PulF
VNVPGLSRKELIWMSHTLETMLSAGVPITRVLDVMARQAKTPRGRRGLAAAGARLAQGATLAEALREQGSFPPFFISLVDAGEQSGSLERTAGELAHYYEFRQRIWSKFLGQIALPVLQYVAAVAVVSFAHYVVAMLADEPSHLGLWLGIGYGAPLALVGGYWLLSGLLGGRKLIHELILCLPVVGPAARDMALAQFSLVLFLLYEAAFPIVDALRRALNSTGNAAFAARGDRAALSIEGSGSLTDALRATGLFPEDYLQVTAVAEESGKVSERLNWLAAHHAERAERSMAALVTALAWTIYAAVAAVIITFIFRMFMRYIASLNAAMP